MTSNTENPNAAQTDDDEDFPPIVTTPLTMLAISGISSIVGFELDNLIPPSENNPSFMVYWDAGRMPGQMPLVSMLWLGDDLSVLVTVEAGNGADNALADRIAGYCARRLISCEIVEEDDLSVISAGYDEGHDDEGTDQDYAPLDPSITIN